MNKFPVYRVILFLAVMGLFGGGCATNYNKQAGGMKERWLAGDLPGAAGAASQAAKNVKNETDRDAVVLRLEQGSTALAAGQFKESLAAFQPAEEGINVFEDREKKRAGSEAVAVLTNPAMLPYEGYTYDKVMLNTYKAVNYLQMGELANARVEFNRARERQDDALAINAKRIEKMQAAAEKEKVKKQDLDKVQNDSKFSSEYKNYYLDLDEMKAYANYVNPLTEYLSGLFFMSQATGGSDVQDARKSFERVLGMAGENKFITADLKMTERMIAGQPITPTTYVIFETGCAPVREQITIDVPLFIFTPAVPYTGLAFPRLKFQQNYARELHVKYGDASETTATLCSMDSVVAQEFKNDMPRVITRTVASAAIKAGASYGISEGVKRIPYGGEFAAKLAWALYLKSQNVADLRTWNTLPKEFEFCHFPTPADRKVEISVPGSNQVVPITIADGTVNVIWVRSTSSLAPLSVSQFKLK